LPNKLITKNTPIDNSFLNEESEESDFSDTTESEDDIIINAIKK